MHYGKAARVRELRACVCACELMRLNYVRVCVCAGPCSCTGELVSTFDTLRGEWAEKKGKMVQLHAKMRPSFAEDLLKTIEELDPNQGARS